MNPQKIRTKFVPDGVLTASDISNAVILAQRCGISEPEEIQTFHYLPGESVGVSVKSTERTNAPDVIFDEIDVKKSSWWGSSSSATTKKVGDFWAEPSWKFTMHFREYEFSKERIRINIGYGIDTNLADGVISAFKAKKFRFFKGRVMEYNRVEMERLIQSKPSGLSRGQNGELRLHLRNTLDEIRFSFDDGEIVLIGLDYVVI